MPLPEAFPRRRFNSDEIMRMMERGILGDNEPFELLGGELIATASQGPGHAALVEDLREQLRRAYGHGSSIREEKPLDCGAYDLPEPDLVVLVGGTAQYRLQHPRGLDALLVIEVAWSSQEVDRAKTSVYARAAVPEYWLIDVPARRVEAHSKPHPSGSYENVAVVEPGQTLNPPGTSALWALDALLP